MSKNDEIRALREARYERTVARAAGKPKDAPAKVQPAPAPKAAVPAQKVAKLPAAEPDGTLCGHRSMNGRTCTREDGHAAKSHRYS